jgi:cell division protein FtsB
MASPTASSPPPARSTKLTGRAALLAVVLCVIALSLAYPVREYIAQRQQIGALISQQQTVSAQVKALQAQESRLGQPWYVEQRARELLHWCGAGEQCYEVINGSSPFVTVATKTKTVTPWYDKLWHSVQRADQGTSR